MKIDWNDAGRIFMIACAAVIGITIATGVIYSAAYLVVMLANAGRY